LLTKRLASKPPSASSACASELQRRLGWATDRASVRRWALAHRLAPDTRFKPTPKPVKRGQARDYAALWQYDATPHAFLPGTAEKQVLLNRLDDATRDNVGALIYGINSRSFALRGQQYAAARAERAAGRRADLTADLLRFDALARHLPPHAIKVAESGIRPANAARLRDELGYDAILVGTALLTSPDGVRAELAKFENALVPN